MRGKAEEIARLDEKSRITPAYAGKSLSPDSGSLLHQDHPRLCGEKSNSLFLELISDRITPAYAGKRRKSLVKTPS